MKRKMALLMALVFTFVCMVPAVFAEETVTDEVIDVVEETVSETEEIPEEETEETLAEDAEKEITEDIPVIEENAEDEIILEEEVIEDEMTLQAVDSAVQEVADAITEEMLTSDREPAHAVTKNLDMSLRGDIDLPDGVTVTFESNNTEVIGNDGKVVRAIGSDTDVKVTATVSKAGSDDAVKELNFKVLDMKTAVYYSENFYYPELVGTDTNVITDIGWTSSVSTGTEKSIKKDADGNHYLFMDYLGSSGPQKIVPINAKGNKITLSMDLSFDTTQGKTKMLDLHYNVGGTKGFIGYIRIQTNDKGITSVGGMVNLNETDRTQLTIEFDMVNKTMRAKTAPDGEWSKSVAISNAGVEWTGNIQSLKFQRGSGGSPAGLIEVDNMLVVTHDVDISDPQVSLDMIDESCFTYTDSKKIVENFSFVVPESVKKLAEHYGMDVTLSSDKPSVVSFDGYNATVTDGEYYQDVTLTVTVSNGDKSVSKSYTVSTYDRVQYVFDMIDESCFTYTDSKKITENFSFVVPETIKDFAELYDINIKAESDKVSSISFDGYNATVTKGEDEQDVILTITVSKGDKSASKQFKVTVKNLTAVNMIEAEVPVITDNGDNKDISVDVYCKNLKEGETEAPVYLFAVRKDKESGKIDRVDVDTATLTIGESATLTASLPDGGDTYDYVVYVWDSFEGQKSLINQPPAEPAEVEVTDTTAGTADLSWTKADDDRKAVASYNIYRDGNLVGSTDVTSYTGENLDFGDTYTFGVTTVDDSGLESEYMAETEVTTKDVPTITYVSKDPVEAPNATQTNNDNILHSWAGSNSTLWTRPAVADGRMCHETTSYDRISADGGIQKIYSFFYTRSPFTYIDADTRNIVLEITYFDVLEDGATSETISVDYQGGSSSVKYTNTGYWKTKVIEVNNAKFTEEAKTEFTEKYNIRFKATKPGLKVYQTTVANANEYVRPAASIKMTDALTLRDILVYREDGQISYDEANGEKCLKIESGNTVEMDVETIASGQRNVNVEITYFDEGEGSIVLEYAGEEGPGMEIISRGNSGEWKTKVITLDDAKLDGSLESSFGRTVDLKLFGDGDTKIKAVRVY